VIKPTLELAVPIGLRLCARPPAYRLEPGFDALALATAKEQVEQIISIDNLAPVCSIACQAYFSQSGLSFRMDDPSAKRNDRSRTIKMSGSEFVHAYDDPLRRIIELRGASATITYEGRPFRGARIEEADLWVAVLDDNLTPPLDKSEADFLATNQYLGGDQVLIRLGPTWSEANMRLQPHQRSN
jgi:hypothetical protein